MPSRVWYVKDALQWTSGYLEEKGVAQARVSAEWLLSAATGLSRVELYAYHDRPLTPDELSGLREAVKLRAAGTPLQYVTGEMPFRHVVIHAEPGVFIPRPETEVLVEEALRVVGQVPAPLVVDLCTGSGCVACSIATEHGGSRVYGTDLSQLAVRVAEENARRLAVGDRTAFALGDLFEPLPSQLRGQVDLVAANPPYIPSADVPELPEEVLGYEPHLALDGGPDGLETARRAMHDSVEWLRPSGVLCMELDERCVNGAAQEMEPWYEDVRTVLDLTGRPRVVVGRKR